MFIRNYPAIKLKSNLIISDIHLGVVREFAKKGIHLPSQSIKFANRINYLIDLTDTNKLIINGDLKHSISFSISELKEIKKFLDLINAEVILIKGNHDGNIEDIGINVKHQLRINKYIITHGHMNIKEKSNLILGHTHPLIMLKDEYNMRYVKRVWLVEKERNIIILPAFNELVGGEVINNTLNLLGPVCKFVEVRNMFAYLLDGTQLGMIGELHERITHAK